VDLRIEKTLKRFKHRQSLGDPLVFNVLSLKGTVSLFSKLKALADPWGAHPAPLPLTAADI